MYKLMIYLYFMSVIAMASCNTVDGYIVKPDDPTYSYKLVYFAQTWVSAKNWCKEDNATLAMPKSQDQFEFIQKLVRAMHYPSIVGSNYKLLVWVGFNNMDNYKVWVDIEGENIEYSDFHQWVDENGNTISDDPTEPHCAGIDAINTGLRDWWCQQRQPFICERKVVKHIVLKKTNKYRKVNERIDRFTHRGRILSESINKEA